MFSGGAKENIGKEKVMNKNGCICISSFFLSFNGSRFSRTGRSEKREVRKYIP